MNYSQEELLNMSYMLGECDRNCLLASRVYAQRYPALRHPDERAFRKLKTRFEANLSLVYEKSERRKTATGEENEFLVLGSLVENPHASVRELEQQLGISKTSVSRIIKRNKFHPYHVQLVQELDDDDMRKRLHFSRWASDRITEHPTFFTNVLFSDEATFHKNGYVNRHNFHYYSDINPHFIRPIDHQHRWSLNVWVGIIDNRILGPYFFDRNVNGDVYLEFLQNDLEDYLDALPLQTVQRMWFQQDGAPAHYSILVRDYLNRRFPRRWIGRGGPVRWPPRSPDLNKLDYFLWGYVKDKVYRDPPTTRDNMKNRIRAAIREIDGGMLGRVNHSFSKRIEQCIRQNGGYIEPYL